MNSKIKIIFIFSCLYIGLDGGFAVASAPRMLSV